jgi:tetratricopeptide (TPR) repeat protein
MREANHPPPSYKASGMVRASRYTGTTSSLYSEVRLLAGLGEPAAAMNCHERALAIYRKRLGDDHPYTGHTLSDLAGVLRAQGDLTGARALYERALVIRDARLGADHPETIQSRKDLAAVSQHWKRAFDIFL